VGIRRAFVIGMALIGVLGLSLAPAAAAKKKKRAKSVQVVTASNSSSATTLAPISATATCPPGTRALSGGFNYAKSTSDLGLGLAVESVRVGETQWRVSGKAGTVGSPITLTTDVYCAKLRGTLSEASQTVTLPPFAGDRVTGTATCPAGTRLLSGGYYAPSDDTDNRVLRSSAVGSTGWSVEVERGSHPIAPPQPTSPVTVSAYCFQPAKVKGKRKKRRRPPSPRPLTLVSAVAPLTTTQYEIGSVPTAPCSGRLRGISGGFALPSAPVDDYSYAEGARFVNGVWTVSALQADSAAKGSPLTALEYCG
jgi:hypothetical protein